MSIDAGSAYARYDLHIVMKFTPRHWKWFLMDDEGGMDAMPIALGYGGTIEEAATSARAAFDKETAV